MSDNRTSLSRATTYRETGEFWDRHDTADYWEQTEPVEFEVDIESEVRRRAGLPAPRWMKIGGLGRSLT